MSYRGYHYCHIEHVAAPAGDTDPSDELAFWESACPAAGGIWQPD